MLHEVSGDILKSKAAVIVHGVAPNDPFHSGLALQLRERFPAMHRDFRHYCQSTHAKPGDLWAWAGIRPDDAGKGESVRLVALMTQEGGYEHGAKPGLATLANVNHALRRLQKWIEVERPSSVAVPKLATGVGGLDWKDVMNLITQHLSHVGIPVYVYSIYHKDVEADERPNEPVASTCTIHR